MPDRRALAHDRSSRPRAASSTATNEDLFLNLANDSSPSTPQEREREQPVRATRLRSSSTKMSGRRPLTNDFTTKADSSPTIPVDSLRDQRYLQADTHSKTSLSTIRSSNDTRLRNIKTSVNNARRRDNFVAHDETLKPSDMHFSIPGSFDYSSTNGDRHGSFSKASRPLSQANDTESVESTTAASTVWDELEDLKSRMRKMEMSTGSARLLGSFNDSADRPQTATTRTTNSTSPNMTQPKPVLSADLHPLLRSALSKAQVSVRPDIYSSLESCANDALNQAMLARRLESFVQMDDDENGTTRDMRRKADDLCRSLTELCIALCDDEAMSSSPLRQKPSARPSSRDKTSHQETIEFSPIGYLDRRSRTDLATRPTSRLVGALDSGRNSSQLSILHRRPSLQADAESSSVPPNSRRLHRSTYDQSYTETDATGASEDRDPTLSAPSRAMTVTEFGARSRPSASSTIRRFSSSRQHTSRQPASDDLYRSSTRLDNSSVYSLNSARTNDPHLQRQPSLSPSPAPQDRQPSLSRSPPSSYSSTNLAERLAERRRAVSAGASMLSKSVNAGSAGVSSQRISRNSRRFGHDEYIAESPAE